MAEFPSPAALAAYTEDSSLTKAGRTPLDSFMLAVMAGAFIALGFVFYTTSQVGMGTDAWPIGISKIIGGVAFSAGLMLVIVTGADLFTSTTMTVMPLLSRRLQVRRFLAHWGIVYAGNFVGSLVMAGVIVASKTHMHFSGGWGLVAIDVAESKVTHGWMEALLLGILANFAVCLAVWMANSGRTTTDKCLAVIGPIALFVATGFEHSVANMFMIPAGILIKNVGGEAFFASDAVTSAGKTAADYADLTTGSFLWNNLVPVTIGNIIGGAVFVGIYYWVVFRRRAVAEDLAAEARD